ncbi:MAG: hypothetical protein PVH61_00030 [Candidatus Aminicenantes bacterium]|jgi:hypothetical protein
MKKLFLHIIDDTNINRRDRTLENAIGTSHFIRAYKEDNSSILAVHYKDALKYKDGKPIAACQTYKGKLIVAYSGGDIEKFLLTEDRNCKRVLRIERVVEQESPISEFEWNWIYRNINETGNNFREQVLRYELVILPALAILCQGYLMAGVAAGKIQDKEVEKLIFWNDKIKINYPKIKSGWETVTNPQWWDDLGKIKDIKEQVRREIGKKCDENVEKLIDYINGTNDIEDFVTVKTVFKKLKDEK